MLLGRSAPWPVLDPEDGDQSNEPSNRTQGDTDLVSAAVEQEEEVLMRESEEASYQWVRQMMTASDAPMPFKYQVGNLIVALLATTLVIVAFHEPASADLSPPQLQ